MPRRSLRRVSSWRQGPLDDFHALLCRFDHAPEVLAETDIHRFQRVHSKRRTWFSLGTAARWRMSTRQNWLSRRGLLTSLKPAAGLQSQMRVNGSATVLPVEGFDTAQPVIEDFGIGQEPFARRLIGRKAVVENPEHDRVFKFQREAQP